MLTFIIVVIILLFFVGGGWWGTARSGYGPYWAWSPLLGLIVLLLVLWALGLIHP